MFVSGTQLLYPDIFNFYLDQSDVGNHSWPNYQQHVRIIKCGLNNQNNINEYSGIIEYKKNSAKIEFEHMEEIKENIETQAFYLHSPLLKVSKDDLAQGNYFYYFRLKSMIELKGFFEQLSPFFGETKFKNRQQGIAWIPINTSDQQDDIAIGLRGNLKTDYSGTAFYTLNVSQNYIQGKFENEMSFFDLSLKNMTQGTMENKIVESSEILCGLTETDFKERIQYVNLNGKKVMGVVIVADETFLDRPYLENFDLIRLIRTN